jgi:hypothetical protein
MQNNFNVVGWYANNNIYVVYTGVEPIGDVKTTITHEFLHHINYLIKITPYRYLNELKRDVFTLADNCYYYREPTIQEIYNNFFTLEYIRMIMDENWNDKYDYLTDTQKKLVNDYKVKNKEKLGIQCSWGRYKPSNYWLDEKYVREICLELDGVLFNMSEEKKQKYKENIAEIEMIIKDAEDYEKRNNFNAESYEKN